MTRENAKALLPIIKAYAEGKVIQIINPSGQWIDSNEPIFNCDYSCYRIKQKVKFRPFANAEECWQEMQKHQPFGWIKPKDDDTISKFMLIDSLMDEVVTVRTNVRFNYHELLEHYTFADCTPFGVKLEE